MNDRDRFKNAIFCDDVREEIGGKKSLMGVYSGDLLPQEFPANIQFALYIEYIPDKDADTSVKLRMLFNNEEILTARVLVEKSDMIANLVVPRGVGTFTEAGEIAIYASVDDGEEYPLFLKQVRTP